LASPCPRTGSLHLEDHKMNNFSTSFLKENKIIVPQHPLGYQDRDVMQKTTAPKDKFFLSVVNKKRESLLANRFSVLKLVGTLFRCSRIVVADEETDSGSIFHILFVLASRMQWKNVDVHCDKVLRKIPYNLIPIQSFTVGVKYILVVDQEPLFWNFTRYNALRMIELKQVKRSYAHLDIPDTDDVTIGPELKTVSQVLSSNISKRWRSVGLILLITILVLIGLIFGVFYMANFYFCF